VPSPAPSPRGRLPLLHRWIRGSRESHGVRKSTVLKAAFEFANVKGVPPDASTKVRVHHLFKLAASGTPEELEYHLARLDDASSCLLHLCGHGICTATRPSACVNPEHVRWGTQAENVKHVAAHEILELAEMPAEYATLLTLFQRKIEYVGLF